MDGSRDETSGDKTMAAWSRRAVVAWAIIGIMLVFALSVRALGLIAPAVELLVMGIIMGFICSPITNALDDRHVPRAVAALIALLVVVAVLTFVVVVLGGIFVQQSVEVLRQVPVYIDRVQAAVEGYWRTKGSIGNSALHNAVNSVVQTVSTAGSSMASDAVRQLSSGAMTGIFGAFDNLVNFFLALVLAYWFAKDYPVIVRELAVVAGPTRQSDVTLLLAVMSRSMGGYMRGQLICSVIDGTGVWIGLSLLSHPYASLLGIVTFFLHFIPVIGPFVAAALATLLALFVSPFLAFWSLVVMVVVANVTDNLIGPLIMRSAVKIHPVLTIVGIVIGSSLGGIVGMVLAIPLTAAIRGVFVYYFETRSKRQIVSEDGALFQSTPHRDESGKAQAAFDALDDDKFFESTRLVSPPPDRVGGAARENGVCSEDMRENRNVTTTTSSGEATTGDRPSSPEAERGEK